jgi:GNAT superfamily N-acetyltransferase
MTTRLIDGDSQDSRRQVVSALTLAFVADPVMRWMYPEPEAYLEFFPKFAAAFASASFSANTTWLSTDGGGASCWQPRGVESDGDAIAAAMFSSIDESKHETTELIFEKMDVFHPTEPHWYLAIVGVEASKQGRGLGAQLMKETLTRCDEEGLSAYLESSNPANISLYQRHGFEEIGEIQFGDAPVITPMLRPAG